MALFTDMLYPRRTQRAQKDRTITRRLTQVHAVAQCERWERYPPLKTRGGAPVKPSKSTQSRDWGEGTGKSPSLCWETQRLGYKTMGRRELVCMVRRRRRAPGVWLWRAFP